MSDVSPKFPKTGGAKKALAVLKKIRNQPPSDRLVEIISEYGDDGEKKNDKTSKKPSVAAKDVGL